MTGPVQIDGSGTERAKCVLAPNPSPMTLDGTNTWLIAEPGSAAQRERRKRILDATIALASKGGYEAVQMRTVAEVGVREAVVVLQAHAEEPVQADVGKPDQGEGHQ